MPRARVHSLLLPLILGLVALCLSQASYAAPNWTWIWAPDESHPPETLYFRQRFHLPRKVLSARLLITADDSFQVFINGYTTPIASGNDWTTVQEFNVSHYLRAGDKQAGDNLLSIQCRNINGTGGLLYKLIVKDTGGHPRLIYSDSSVRVNRHPPVAWTLPALDDQSWSQSREVAPAGAGPWGPLRGASVPDYGRIVRQWDIRAGGAPDANPYNRARNVGDRILMSASVAGENDMQMLAGAGFTLFQTDSDHLSTEEVGPNLWDWKRADSARTLTQQLGLDWCYFTHEAFPPKWYRDTVPFTRIQCLEHHKPVQAFSPWDPKWPAFIERGFKALAKEFGPEPVPVVVRNGADVGSKPDRLSALCVGIHGDYGEAGLLTGARVEVADQKANWIHRFGNDHDHLGFWCDDALARVDFRTAMLKKYGSLADLNSAWHTSYKQNVEIDYPEHPYQTPDPNERRHYLDFIDWYRDGVGHAIEANLSEARKRFPDTLLMLPAGLTDEDIRGGNDNTLIPKLAAKYGAAVRSIHGGFKPFAENAATMLGRLGSACRFYGVPFWTEPPGSLTADQTVERIFESISEGSSGYFDWASNAVVNRETYYRYSKFMKVEKPIVDVAMFYPAKAQETKPDQGYDNTFRQACAYLRDIANYDIVDDRMVNDGCLAKYRVLALWEGTLCDQETLDKIKTWVDQGGVLLAYDFGKVATFAGDTTWFKDLYGYVQDLNPAHVSEKFVGTLPAQYRMELSRPELAAYLGGSWYEPQKETGLIRRWTGVTATLRLPVDPEKHYTLVVRALVPPEAATLSHELLLNGHKLGDLSSVGDCRYQFLIPEDALDGSLATLTFELQTFQPAQTRPGSKDMRQLGVAVESVTVLETGADELPDAPPPAGSIQHVLDLSHLTAGASSDSWVRRYGSGLTIYFPANRNLLWGYVEVLRQAIYHLSSIEPTRRDALPLDEGVDGVYATLFPDKILFYNSQNVAVTKKVTIPEAAFDAWKNEVVKPTETSWTLELKPNSIEAIYFTPPPQELLYECEAFTETGGLKPAVASDCSPGEGPSCIRISAGGSIGTRFRITAPGRYNLFVRCLQGTRLVPVTVQIDGQTVAPINHRVGQTLLAGTMILTKGPHTLTLTAHQDGSVRADFVLLSSDPDVAGYDFATRTVPVE